MGRSKAEGSNGSEAPQKRAQAHESTYVVQLAVTARVDGDEKAEPGAIVLIPARPEDEKVAWEDVETVTVPAKTKRATIVAKVMGEVRFPHAARVRVLDVSAAHVTTVEWEQPPPQLKLGSAS